MLKPCKKFPFVVILTFIYIIMACFYFSIVPNAGTSDHTNIFSDMSGGYKILTYNDLRYSIYSVKSNGETIEENSETAVISDVAFSGGTLIVMSQSLRTTNMTVYNYLAGTSFTVMLPKSNIRSGLFCTDQNRKIYTTVDSSPVSVMEYNSKGKLLKTHSLNSRIISLFTNDSENLVFALTENGIFNISDDQFVGGEIPSGNIEWNGKYAACGGKIYTFDRTKGFCLKYDTGYQSACFTGSELYATAGTMILCLNDDGSISSSFDTGKNITRLSASNNTIAIISGSELTLLNKSSMIPHEKPEEVSARDNTSHKTPESNPIQQSSIQTYSPKKYYIRSSMFTFGENIITGISQGTTFAALKRNIDYGDYSVSAVNHNGYPVSSGILGTGWQIIFTGNEKENVYTVIIKGDITGEGNVNSRDYSLLADYILGTAQPDDIHKIAADINDDETISISDFYSIYSRQ